LSSPWGTSLRVNEDELPLICLGFVWDLTITNDGRLASGRCPFIRNGAAEDQGYFTFQISKLCLYLLLWKYNTELCLLIKMLSSNLSKIKDFLC